MCGCKIQSAGSLSIALIVLRSRMVRQWRSRMRKVMMRQQVRQRAVETEAAMPSTKQTALSRHGTMRWMKWHATGTDYATAPWRRKYRQRGPWAVKVLMCFRIILLSIPIYSHDLACLLMSLVGQDISSIFRIRHVVVEAHANANLHADIRKIWRYFARRRSCRR